MANGYAGKILMPTRATLEELGLKDVAAELAAKGKLPG